jgi:hypothetical protein
MFDLAGSISMGCDDLLSLSLPLSRNPAPQVCCVPSQNRFTVVDGMGKPQICFGDSEVYLIHNDTRKLVGCPVSERRHRILSHQRKAIMQEDLHRSFAFTATRASEQEAKAASNIQRAQEIMRIYVHK